MRSLEVEIVAWSIQIEKLSAGGWRKQGYHGKMHEFTIVVRKRHPITRGIKSFPHGRDELYQNSLTKPDKSVVLFGAPEQIARAAELFRVEEKVL